jgi:hypothetical protein
MLKPYYDSAEQIPEVPGAMFRVQPEGGYMVHGEKTYRALTRVIAPAGLRGDNGAGPSGLRLRAPDGRPYDILLVEEWKPDAVLR